MNQATQLKLDTKAVNTRNMEIAKTGSRNECVLDQIAQQDSLGLNAQILNMTVKLELLSIQTLTTASKLNPSNPTLVSQSIAGLIAVENLSAQVGIGFNPGYCLAVTPRPRRVLWKRSAVANPLSDKDRPADRFRL